MEIKELISGKSQEEAISILTDYIVQNPESEDAYILRGMRYWGCGNRSAAIGDYLAAIRINPESRAKEALKAANEILDYRNKDLYNP
jgi:tetratricopeptide (TPR) repeat protein